MLYRATQDGQVMVGSSDKTWYTGEGNGKPLKYSCLENLMNSMKRQKDRTLKDELPRLVGTQYAIGDQWRKNSRKNENHNCRKLIWSHGPQPSLTQWNYEPCHVGPPKMDRSWWRVLTKRAPLEKVLVHHFSILALRTPWAVWKGKVIGYWKRNSPGQ